MARFDPGAITEAEQVVLHCTALGERAVFPASDSGPPVLRAAFLRHLMLGLPGSDEGEAPWRVALPGVRVRGARIEGELDLADCAGPDGAGLPALSLEDCDISDGVDASYARLARLSLRDSRITWVRALDTVIGGPFDVSGLCPSLLANPDEVAWIDAAGCTIEGDFIARGAFLRAPPKRAEVVPGDQRYALRLRDAEVRGKIDLTGAARAFGGVHLGGAHAHGDVFASGLEVTAGEGFAFHAQAARLGGLVLLDDGFAATGAVWLLSIRIGGTLQCVGGRFSNRTEDGTGVALEAANAEIGGSVLLANGFNAEGQVSLLGAKLGGSLVCSGAHLSNRTEDGTGVALEAANVEIGGLVVLHNEFNAEGQVSLLGAKLGGSLVCGGARLSNQTEGGTGIALVASTAEIGGAVLLCDGFLALGRVSFYSARLGKELDCSGGRFVNPAGAALSSENLRVEGTVFLQDAVVMGDLRFWHAEIGGGLYWRGLRFPATFQDDTAELAYTGWRRRAFDAGLLSVRLNLAHCRVGAAVQAGSVEAGVPLVIDLEGARVATLDDAGFPAGPIEQPLCRLNLDGFTYDRIAHFPPPDRAPGPAVEERSDRDAKARLAWLRRQEKRDGQFRPQPYRQLAKVLRAQGHEEAARKIAIAERDGMQPSAWLFRHLHTAFGTGFGYGYAPTRAAWTLGTVLLVGTFLVWEARRQDVLVLTTSSATTVAAERNGWRSAVQVLPLDQTQPELQCRDEIVPGLYALDLILPVIQLHQENRCEVSTQEKAHPSAWLWRYALVFYSLVGKLVTTLALLTFSGVLKRSDG